MKKSVTALLLISSFLIPLFETVVHAYAGKKDCNLISADCHKKICPLNSNAGKKHDGHGCEVSFRCENPYNKEILKTSHYEDFYMANNNYSLSTFYPFLNEISGKTITAKKFKIPPPDIPPKTI